MTFYTNGLMSKWGFCDGDNLCDLLSDNKFPQSIRHKLLFNIVEKFICPKLNQRVELEFISTNHNPVRAITVNGINVEKEHYNPNTLIKLEPITVEVSDEIVLKEANLIMNDEIDKIEVKDGH